MKKIKSLSAIVLALIMAFSLISVAAESANITIVHEGNLATLNWNGNNVAYIDFSEVEEIDLDTGAAGHGITLCPNNGQTSWKAANRLSDDGYLLFGKEGNTDGNGTLSFGNVYVALDDVNKGDYSSYAIKVDYYGGGGIGLDSGSYINFAYNTASKADQGAAQYKFGSTYNSGQIESCYWLLTDAKFRSAMNNPHGDFRLNTWSGAQILIRRISVMRYDAINFPDSTEVRKGMNEEIASFDFSNLAEVPENGILEGDGLDFYTTQATGNTMAANIFDNGYLLLGKQAHKATDPETGDVTLANGAAYFKLQASNEEKANTPYAVKIEYFGGGIGLDSGSYIDVRFNSISDGNNKGVRKTFGSTFNSGIDQALYYLIPIANFNGDLLNSTCGADFRLETWCGNGTTTGAQMKIKKVSVVKYDPSATVSSDSVYFNSYSKGDLLANQVVVNANTGEFAGINWYNTESVKVVTPDGDRFAVQPKYDGNGLGTIGFRFTDTYVKSAENAKLTVSYWDKGEGKFGFQYNAVGNAYAPTADTTLEDSGELKTVTLNLTNTEFNTAMVGTFDIRLVTNSKDITIESVMIESVIENDINGDGLLNAADVVILRKALFVEDTENEFDINGDDEFNIIDIIAIKKMVLAA